MRSPRHGLRMSKPDGERARLGEGRYMHRLEVMFGPVWAMRLIHTGGTDLAGIARQRTAMMEPPQPQCPIDDARGVRANGAREVCHEADGPGPLHFDPQRRHSPRDEPEGAAVGVDDHGIGTRLPWDLEHVSSGIARHPGQLPRAALTLVAHVPDDHEPRMRVAILQLMRNVDGKGEDRVQLRVEVVLPIQPHYSCYRGHRIPDQPISFLVLLDVFGVLSR